MTWERTYDNKGVTVGNYIGDYQSAKQDFAVCAGFVPRETLFTAEQLTDLFRCCKQALENPESHFSYGDEERIRSIQEQIERLSPGIQERVEALETQAQAQQSQAQTMTIQTFRGAVRHLAEFSRQQTGAEYFSEKLGAEYLRTITGFPFEMPRPLTTKLALTEAGYYDTKPHKVLIVGDLFDRGRKAVELQSFILDLLERDEVILIRGNHGDLFEELVTVDNGLRYDHHLSNGIYSTALQLTGFDKRHAKVSPLVFARAARDTPYYKTILPATVNYYKTDKFVFTHGWIPCSVDRDSGLIYMDNWRKASEQSWRQARWITASTPSERYLRTGKQ